ncbi:ATP-binding protein [Noviherbaspirillum sp. ST9]|uniref:PAS domain-containing sensor histidine kinase n=1 Tax=Noviherbaspirillum sp. ST9 TaxID=3401606 RepID=UPI003B58A770
MTRQKKIDFQTIFETAPAASLVLTPEFLIVAASDRYLEHAMKAREDLVGRRLKDAFADDSGGPRPYTVSELHESLGRVLAQRETEKMPVQKLGLQHAANHVASNDERYSRAINAPLFDMDGRILYLIHSIEDVTDLVHPAPAEMMDEEMHANHGDDPARLRADFEQFTYAASHDLQEPLRMVTSYVQLLARRYKGRLDQDADDFIDFALDGAKRMHNMISDLLRFSRVGTQAMPFAPTSMDAVLELALNNLQRQIESTGATVTKAAMPVVMADEAQMTIVFQSLIDNALKFRSGAPPRIHIGYERRNSEHLFHVRDNGIGIEPQQADHIFVIFRRLHQRGTFPGTGIGLTLCKRIIERHRGRIWVESAPAQGATFYFTIVDTEG